MSPSPDQSFPNRKARTLYEHLREELARRDGDEIYVKARTLADGIGYSSQEIGAYLKQLQGVDTDLEIEQWSWSKATTWRVRKTE